MDKKTVSTFQALKTATICLRSRQNITQSYSVVQSFVGYFCVSRSLKHVIIAYYRWVCITWSMYSSLSRVVSILWRENNASLQLCISLKTYNNFMFCFIKHSKLFSVNGVPKRAEAPRSGGSGWPRSGSAMPLAFMKRNKKTLIFLFEIIGFNYLHSIKVGGELESW